MLIIQNRSISIMVVFCIALHMWWAFMIVMDESALQATGVDALIRVFHDRYLLVFALTAASSMSLVGMWYHTSWASLLLVPQQVLLVLSAAGAISAIFLSQFADGVLRPRTFISADQIYSVLAAVGHTIALIVHIRSKV